MFKLINVSSVISLEFFFFCYIVIVVETTPLAKTTAFQHQRQYRSFGSCLQLHHNTLFQLRESDIAAKNVGHGIVASPSSLEILQNENDGISPNNKASTNLSLIRKWTKRIFWMYVIFTVGYQIGGYNSSKKIIQNIMALDTNHWKGGKTSISSLLLPTTKRVGFVQRFPFVSMVLIAWMVREIWGLVPAWIKQSRVFRLPRAFRGSLSGHEQLEQLATTTKDPDDMTDLATIGIKLQSLLEVAKLKLRNTSSNHYLLSSDGNNKEFDVLGPSLILLQLINQYKARQIKDRSYEELGSSTNTTASSSLPISSFWSANDSSHISTNNCSSNNVEKHHVLDGLDEAFEWADWAYDESKYGTLKENLDRNGFSLLRHDKTQKPGYVGHYAAISKERKIVIIGVKGTSTLEDLLTDCCGLAVTHNLNSPFTLENTEKDVSSNESSDTYKSAMIRCHEGVLISSKRLAEDLQPFIEELILPTSYKILIVGHSLGAAAASLLAVLLKSRIPSLAADVNGTKLRVLAFACPPILDYKNARACSSFITTIVNNSDIITRSSLANLSISLEVLKETNQKLEDRGMSTTNAKSTTALIRKIAEGTKGDLLFQPTEFKDMVDRARDKVDIADPDHLYVPGQVIIMFNRRDNTSTDSNNNTDSTKCEGNTESSSSITSIPKKVSSLFKQRTKQNVIKSQSKNTFFADEFALSNDGTAKVLRSIEMNERMLSDHMSPAYRESIRSLLSQPIN